MITLWKRWKDRFSELGKVFAGWGVLLACILIVIEVKSANSQLSEDKKSITELQASRFNSTMVDTLVIKRLELMDEKSNKAARELEDYKKSNQKELMCMKAEIYRLDKMHNLRSLQDEKLLREYLK